MKKAFKTAVLSVITLGIISLAIPTPVIMACVRCVYTPCPPCYIRAGGNCYRCGTCRIIAECPPR